MSTKRILVGASSLILGAALEVLLAPESDLEVIGIQAGSEHELLRAIEQYKPYGIILNECDLSIDSTLLGHLLLGDPDLRVILVGTEDNWVHFYHRRDILIDMASDLADVIRLS